MGSRKLKVGDMVDFRSAFFAMSMEKVRPGIIIEMEDDGGTDFSFPRTSCKVLWANGRTTSEWYSILEHYESIPRHNLDI